MVALAFVASPLASPLLGHVLAPLPRLPVETAERAGLSSAARAIASGLGSRLAADPLPSLARRYCFADLSAIRRPRYAVPAHALVCLHLQALDSLVKDVLASAFAEAASLYPRELDSLVCHLATAALSFSWAWSSLVKGWAHRPGNSDFSSASRASWRASDRAHRYRMLQSHSCALATRRYRAWTRWMAARVCASGLKTLAPVKQLDFHAMKRSRLKIQ